MKRRNLSIEIRKITVSILVFVIMVVVGFPLNSEASGDEEFKFVGVKYDGSDYIKVGGIENQFTNSIKVMMNLGNTGINIPQTVDVAIFAIDSFSVTGIGSTPVMYKIFPSIKVKTGNIVEGEYYLGKASSYSNTDTYLIRYKVNYLVLADDLQYVSSGWRDFELDVDTLIAKKIDNDPYNVVAFSTKIGEIDIEIINKDILVSPFTTKAIIRGYVRNDSRNGIKIAYSNVVGDSYTKFSEQSVSNLTSVYRQHNLEIDLISLGSLPKLGESDPLDIAIEAVDVNDSGNTFNSVENLRLSVKEPVVSKMR